MPGRLPLRCRTSALPLIGRREAAAPVHGNCVRDRTQAVIAAYESGLVTPCHQP